jgi:hypothetical protein
MASMDLIIYDLTNPKLGPAFTDKKHNIKRRQPYPEKLQDLNTIERSKQMVVHLRTAAMEYHSICAELSQAELRTQAQVMLARKKLEAAKMTFVKVERSFVQVAKEMADVNERLGKKRNGVPKFYSNFYNGPEWKDARKDLS